MILLAGYPESVYIYSERIVISLGLTTLIFALATVFSCRTFISVSKHLGVKEILKNRVYKGFYKYHAYYWWGFWAIFSLHLFSGVMHAFMTPEVPDPDKYLHTYSLWSGLSALVLISAVLTSCRIAPSPLSYIFNKNPLTTPIYKLFYKFHSYYWLIFFGIIIGHYTFGFMHSGWWPT